MSPIRKLYNHIQGDAFLKNNVIFFFGSLSIAFLNYLYYPVMSRVMTLEQFGEIQTIFSLVFLSGVVLTVFRMIVLHITTNSPSENFGQKSEGHQVKSEVQLPSATAPASDLRPDDRPAGEAGLGPSTNTTVSALYTAALLTHLPFFLFLIIASPFLSHYFSFESSWAFSVFAFYFLLSVSQTFYTAHIQGKSAFQRLNISNLISSGGKLILSFLLVYAGFGVVGATFALVLASLLSLYYMKHHSKELTLSFSLSRTTRTIIKKEIPYGLLILVSLGFVTFLYSADVLVVKRLFPPDIAGLYSGVATIARIIFFATGSISGVLLASITTDDRHNKNRITLVKGVLLTTAIGGGSLVLFSLFPSFIINLLIGAKYLPFAHFLPSLSLYLFLVSLLNLFVSYLLALRAYILFPISLIGASVLFGTLFLSRLSIEHVILAFTGSSMIAILLLAIPSFSKRHLLLWKH